MSNKNNNIKKVSIILGILLALLLIVKLKDKKQGDRSFKSVIIQVDDQKVHSISVYPKEGKDKVEFVKQDDQWMLKKGDKLVQADAGTLEDMFSQIKELKPKRVASLSKDKWENYEVTDSLGTRIVLNEGKKALADFIVGKFSYSQSPNQSPYQQQPQMTMTSFVRLSDEKETYAVDGYLSMLFNRNSESFRDDVVVSGDPEVWNKLVYDYGDNRSFTLQKQNNHWMLNGIMADSTKVDDLFSKMRVLSSSKFADEVSEKEIKVNNYSLRIEGDNITPIEIKAYSKADGTLYTSSLNTGSVFKDEKIETVLFIQKESLMVE